MINREKFRQFLKTNGRTENAANRVIRLVQTFAEFQFGRNQATLDHVTESDLDAFIDFVEKESESIHHPESYSSNAKSYLWAIRYYYQFSQNSHLETYASFLRQNRIKRKPFLLKDFRGVHSEHLAALASLNIENTAQMLKAGSTSASRQALAEKTGLPQEMILELVKLSDLARIPGIKGIRARLYHDAGFDTIQKLAQSQVDEVLQITQDFVCKTGFDGIAPLPAEISFSIKTARSLPQLIEYE